MNISAMMAQAKKMQAEMEKATAELMKKEFTVSKQGITVVVMGNRKIKSVDINEILIDPEDKDILESMILIAVNEAMDLITNEEEKLKPAVPSGMPF